MRFRVGFPDGSQWEIPLQVVESYRAQEIGVTTGDPLTPEGALSWLASMDWNDVRHHAECVVAPNPDYAAWWREVRSAPEIAE